MNLPDARVMTLGLLALALALATTGCRDAPGRPRAASEVVRPDQITDFATLYGQNCAACHGENGTNGAAISLANPVYLAVAGATNIQHVTALGVAGTAMPPFSKASGGTLTDQQIAVLTQEMISTWGNVAALTGNTSPAYANSVFGNASQGEKEFSTFCARCHGDHGTGIATANGVVTGSLIDPAYLALISDQGLRSIIVAGRTEQGAHDWRSYQFGPGALRITDHDIADIVAWLASNRTTTPGQPYQQRP